MTGGPCLSSLGNRKGSYLLLLCLVEPTQINVGRLGAVFFPKGYYAYTGSAMGPGGLRARISRHLRPEKALHWHIDYLTGTAVIVEVRVEESVRLECEWSSRIVDTVGAVVAPKFGSSDCSCITHLFFFPDFPDLSGFGRPLSLASERSSGTS